jgi:hypothetical protein
MRRSRTYPVTPAPQHRHSSERNEAAERSLSPVAVAGETPSHAAALVRNIASFLTLSDAASLVSFMSPAESWAVGVELDASGEGTDTASSWWGLEIETPLTPALVALSPGATPRAPNDDDDDEELRRLRRNNSSSLFAEDMEELLQERRRRWAQEKIINAVFSHPRSLRSYCWEAYLAAKEIQMQKEEEWAALQQYRISLHEDGEAPPEMQVEPHVYPSVGSAVGVSQLLLRKRKRLATGILDWRSHIVHEVVDWIFSNVPISVLLDLLEATGFLFLDTTAASLHITVTTLQNAVAALGRLVCTVWDTVTHCVTNPFQVLEAIISLQFNAMGKTSEVLVSGIQSVATGVESASNMALYRLSATANMSASVSSFTGGHHSAPADAKSAVFNKRLLHKLSSINNAALVVDYRESEEDHCGLTRHAVSRTRRMMHYSVSLRPFVATVAMNPTSTQRRDVPIDDGDVLVDPDTATEQGASSFADLQRHNSFSSGSLDDDGGFHSPFMCTPQSFPPTPHSRQMVIAQRSQLSDDVVFLARSRLRVHDGLDSDNARTRERSQVQEETKRWAVFASVARESGIELTCGKHIATKSGGLFYASARSMVAVLRNCFVYFEFTVLPRPVTPTLATLAIGLSTEEMPPNTLVGAWPSSVGLCTTGQILMAGQWCSPADPAQFAYGVGSTVGCLVCVDEEKSLETWDGVMVHASIRLNVNGVTVTPPVSILPTSGSPGSSLHITSAAVPVGASAVHPGVLGAVGNNGGERVSPSPLTTTGRLELPLSTLTLLVPSTEELYPTVTLQSPATSVVCRFSSEDVVASSREVIGAPPGVAVYAIDGSVILNELEDSSS